MTPKTDRQRGSQKGSTKESARRSEAGQDLPEKSQWALLALLALSLGLHLWSLMRFPPPFVDEAWLASRAWSLIQTGQAFGPLDHGVFDRFEGYWTFFPWLPVWIQSLAFRLSGEPALLALRMLSLLFGVALLFTVYSIAKRLYGKLPGLVAVLLVSLSWPFLYSAHLARYDIMTAALGFSAIALYLNNQRGRAWVSLISGLCIGLAFEIHPHAAVYGPTIVALYFLHYRWSMFRRRRFWSFVAGIGTGLVFYALLHMAPYPSTYSALNQLVFAASHTPPILTLDPGIILQAFSEMGTLLVGVSLALIPLIVWAAIALMRRRSEADKTLLVLNAALLGGVILLFRNKAAYYAIMFTLALDLMVGVFLLQTLQQPWYGRFRDYVRVSLIWGCCILALVLNLSTLRMDSWKVYTEAQDFINGLVRPGEAIMASQTFWLGLHEHTYYSWENLIYYRRYVPGSTLEDALRELGPDILVIDRHLGNFISDEPKESGYSQHLNLPRTDMNAFLSRSASLIGVLDIEAYGPIRVYRIDWGEAVQETNRGMEARDGEP
jgi:4-amino-4-deoxy-L-arabinose transferase-like glycosyltransferase